ncbi:GDYXXLXY domain-containing protein [Paenibacillus sp. sgz500958]|uniref:GDYXXLXY domain-containing protein n=1 Tax=Paenibacillus sp. sgz500958 TaxID=3242475 RepID=UPI0036D2527A
MLRLNGARTGLILGVSLVLAAIIYFFAANWGGLDRSDKIILSAGLVLLFYATAFVFSRLRYMPTLHSFLSNVFLLGGCISFGAAVALLHQIYNSHADSYMIFLVWAVPALLLSLITRYNPLYVLTYALAHLALWLYFFPSSLTVIHNENELLIIGFIFAGINLMLFALLEMNRIQSAPLKYLSFILFHISLLTLTNSWIYETYYMWMNLLCLAFIAGGFFYFIRVRLNKPLLSLNALAASAFAVMKFIELAVRHASISFFFFGLMFVALLLAGNIWFFRILHKLGEHDQTVEDTEAAPEEHAGEHRNMMVGRVVSVIVTILGVIIGSISLIGFVILVWDNPQYFLYVLALLFVIPMILLPRFNPVVRYTLLTIGYITGLISLVWIDNPILSILFILLSAAGWIRLEGSPLTYALLNLNIAVILFQVLKRLEMVEHGSTYIILLLAVLNAAIYSLHFRFPVNLQRRVGRTALFFTQLFLFWLTFFSDIFPHSYELFNILVFAGLSLLVFTFQRKEQDFEAGLSLAFWFAFLAYKYYDIFWSLLHKSVTLALLGLIVITVSYMLARRNAAAGSHEEQGGLLGHNFILITIVILLQFGYLGVYVAQSETLLTTGTTLKLEIEPLDPRSLLQGDYVVLNYSISTPPESAAADLESYQGKRKIKVVVVPDEKGVYVFDRVFHSGDILREGEVVLNGKISGWGTIHYGIETYFVPEGTGLAVQSKARFASIRVNTHGDALLEALSEQ